MPNKPTSPWIKLGLLALLVGGMIVAMRKLPVMEWMDFFTGWVKDHGALGIALFLVAHVIGTSLFVPASAFTIAAGLTFGLFWGVTLAVGCCAVGSAFSFFISRYVARSWVEKLMGNNEKFRALDGALAEAGWKLVLLMRLTPVMPFPVTNYFFGITKIRFWPYFWASAFGVIPGTTLYCYLGYVGKVALTSQKQQRGTMDYVLLGVGLALLVAVVIYMTKIAKKALRDMEEKGKAAETFSQ